MGQRAANVANWSTRGDMIGTTRMVWNISGWSKLLRGAGYGRNVREWVDDWYDEGRRVLKGGSFSDNL